jgi:hypothetical protein
MEELLLDLLSEELCTEELLLDEIFYEPEPRPTFWDRFWWTGRTDL